MSEKKESAPDVPATLDISSIAVIGGTGGVGSALAWCWGRAGFKIFIGSRNAEIMWMRELVSFLSLKRQDSKAGTPDPLTILLSANPSLRFSFSSTNAIKWMAPASELSGIDV